jgi:vacuolar-type H+-ATPase subunit C/Vma6
MLDIYFLSGKINSLEKKFIDYEKCNKLIESKTIEEFINLLEGTFFKFPTSSPKIEEIFKFFENERVKLIEEIIKTFEGEIQSFFILKYDYYNLGILLENKKNYSFYGSVNFYILKEAFENNNFSKIPKILKDTIVKIKRKGEDKEKLLILKNDYYEKMYEISEKISNFINGYVKIEIDFANLNTYLNFKLFEGKVEMAKFIRNGKIKIENFLDEKKLKKSFFSEYGKELVLSEEELEIERYKVISYYLKEGRIKPDGIDKIVSFYLAREIEIESLQRLTISKFYGKEEDFLRRIIVPVYQYR